MILDLRFESMPWVLGMCSEGLFFAGVVQFGVSASLLIERSESFSIRIMGWSWMVMG
jgi:hypothetical protein